MRATYRSHSGNKSYWATRWERAGTDTGRLELGTYPGKQVKETLPNVPEGPILEAGCGAGRVLAYLDDIGKECIGIDFIRHILVKIAEQRGERRLAAADITNLPFPDDSFAAVFAFGLYHNLEDSVGAALAETLRVLRPGGLLCASFRADNLQNRVIDWLADRKAPPATGAKQFHKMNYTLRETENLVREAGFTVLRTEFVDNMPFLYKFKPFRHASQHNFVEASARAEGYRLSRTGAVLHKSLKALFPQSFHSINVITATQA